MSACAGTSPSLQSTHFTSAEDADGSPAAPSPVACPPRSLAATYVVMPAKRAKFITSISILQPGTITRTAYLLLISKAPHPSGLEEHSDLRYASIISSACHSYHALPAHPAHQVSINIPPILPPSIPEVSFDIMSSYLALLALALSVAATPLETRQSCADVTAYFARGTSESGTLGTVVGPQFKSALQSALGSRTLEFVGIPYPATVAGFYAGGDQGGATTMADDVTAKASACPNTKIVMSGYSQGAQVTHLAAGKLSSDVQNRVNAVVVFGDPDNGQPFPGPINNHVKTFCHTGDDICAGGDVIGPSHLDYGNDAPAAADFVVSQI
ncbi:putative catalyzes the hydrolysis of cutin, a polyester that forms the structure of plant cuticle [Lyophyllum shimeji]|uniref:Cutinase n=1 Tax=Lyophyllum shimeji TaxID=47721 RepID=A0A9P3PLV8_LYOSH|nr:putative catalyzes the hydrolysis of cutin, a polyester that forms the structure of plant cuticle [Lyophyllum shimeji]